MSIILFPDLTNPEKTATLTRWLTKVGDFVTPSDTVAEFESENGYVIVEAATAGRVSELLVQPGQTVTTNAGLVRVELSSLSPGTNQVSESLSMSSESIPKEDIGNVIPILMPQAGNTMEEGTVVAWHAKEGESIAIGQVICEIETDKATMDFESPDAGRLARIVAKVDEPVPVKHIIAVLADKDDDADEFLTAHSGATITTPGDASRRSSPAETVKPAISKAARDVAVATVASGGRVKASPAARKIASERGIELAAVRTGSGPGGRILSADVTDVSAADSSEETADREIRRPLSRMRRAIGLNLQQSKQTVPHFYVRTTIHADPMLEFYREQKQRSHCSLNDVITLAVGRVMREFPAVRSQIHGSDVIEYAHANIGIAVGIDDGLVVPVVLAVDTLSLAQLAAESKRIVEQARRGRLENIGKGNFTISNLGMYGVEDFSAIINPPESGILAVSSAREAVIVEHGAMRIGHQMAMTLSADHRIVDGVLAARFMKRLREVLEHPHEVLA